MPNPLYLIDGSSQMYRAYHAPVRTAEGGLLRNAQGTPTNAVYIFVTMLRKLLNEHKPEYIAASFDLPGRTFRDDLVADYKANRAPMPDELAQQIPMVHAACEALGVPILTSERYEADDVIGTLAEKAAAAGFDVAIVTDGQGLLSARRRRHPRLQPARRRARGTTRRASKKSSASRPEQVVDVLALMGDTIDNIKGVPGIGEKGARELIATYGSLENLLAHAAEIKNKRYREGLLAQRRRMRVRARSWRGSGPTCRSSSTPTRCDTAADRASAASRSSTSSASGRWPRSTRRPPSTIAKTLSHRQHAGRRAGAGRSAASRRDASRCASFPIGPTAMRAAIVGLAFSTAPRDADYVPIGHRGARRHASSCRSTSRSTRFGPCSRTRRSARSATI